MGFRETTFLNFSRGACPRTPLGKGASGAKINFQSHTNTLWKTSATRLLLAFFYNLSFMQANPSIGPLLTAFIEMLIDVAKFFFYFSFMFLAFTVSFTKLNMQYFTVKGYFESIQNQGNSTIDNDALMK